jgi:hypothetical protein
MKTVIIHPPIDIYDDEEYCHHRYINQEHMTSEDICERLNEDNICTLFNEELDAKSLDMNPDDDFDNVVVKCDECKKYWFQAKHNQK